jgi:hypothetical protein
MEVFRATTERQVQAIWVRMASEWLKEPEID